MDKPVERNYPDGVEDYIQWGGTLDLEFSIGDYSKLNLHQKIDLAYKRMVDVGLDLFPLPPPSTSPDIPDIIYDEQYEQIRQDQYFSKWIKQNEYMSSKNKEFYYYLMENEDEIMNTDITKDHPINILFPIVTKITKTINQLKKHPSEFANNCQSEVAKLDIEQQVDVDEINNAKLNLIENQIKMSEIELSDYGEEFDDVFNNHGEFLGPNEQEISENEYEQICKKYEQEDKINSSIKVADYQNQYSSEITNLLIHSENIQIRR
ncbi:MAG: hypothetical protein EZS28_009301 [Streblomastix strix]|uniref:Uncharacterized protein n=1 Tax=Streblomastix strix TaxID=222440 RepID=A0A5J4WLC9_9EUKA|nr:MAG: hypothetical protein EZS28_009301 [Streblomastix strix]